MYALVTFQDVLESLLQTAGQSYQGEETEDDPTLAEVLVSRYRSQSRLALDAYTETWALTDERRSEEEDCLIIEVPVLVERMYRLIAEDWLMPARVVDIVTPRVQMKEEVRLAYEQKFGHP